MSTSLYNKIMKMLSLETVEGLYGELSRFRSWLESSREGLRVGHVEDIEDLNEATIVFTDGSNAITERRGAGVAVFSASSLAYHIERGDMRFIDKYVLTPDICFLIILPRFYVGTRANNIMRSFEFLVTAYMADHIDDVDMVLLDGSYVSTLLSARWGIEHLYRDLLDVFYRHLEVRNLDYSTLRETFVGVCDTISSEVSKLLNTKIFCESRTPRIIAERFLSNYVLSISSVVECVEENFGIPQDGQIPLLNYVAMFIETNFMMKSLRLLLETAKNLGIPVVWLNKEPESRILAKSLDSRLLRMFTDALILDFVLRKGEFLLYTEMPKITASGKYISDRIDIRDLQKTTHAVVPETADIVYGEFGDYGVIYVKYSDFVIQYTYPRSILGHDRRDRERLDSLLLGLVKLLGVVSPVGYPEPMIHAHLSTLLKSGLAEVMADSLASIIDSSGVDVLKRFIGKSGRRLVGI